MKQDSTKAEKDIKLPEGYHEVDDSFEEDDTPEPAPKKEEPKSEPADESEEASETTDAEELEAEKDFSQDINKPGFLSRLFRSKKTWKVIALLIVLTIVGLLVVPVTRYKILNTAGVRSSASLIVSDQSTRQPLKNVKVTVHGISGTTNDQGRVTLHEVPLGETKLVIERRAFAGQQRDITIGWGSNPLNEILLEPTGLQFTLSVHDFLSNKPIAKAEATAAGASSFSNENGEIVLTVDVKNDEPVDITVHADGYRNRKLTLNEPSDEPEKVTMVPAQKQIFVSNRSGRYDVYRIDVDGKAESLLLSGTGHERSDLELVPHPHKELAALVSTRDNVRNAQGELKQTLTLINAANKSSRPITTEDGIQIIGWSGDDLVYIKIADTVGDTAVRSQRLVSYNVSSGSATELTKGSYFNDVKLVGSTVYYAPASNPQLSAAKNKSVTGLFSVGAGGGSSKHLMGAEIWSISRTSHNELALSTGDHWYSYTPGDPKPMRATGSPANLKDRQYIGNQDGKQELWVEQRDGKGALIVYNPATGKDKVLVTQSGLIYPVHWAGDAVVYRVKTESESADYIVSTQGGKPRKIIDVATTNNENWYYY